MILKLLANRLTRDPKIVIHGNSCIILYLNINCVTSFSLEDTVILNPTGADDIISYDSRKMVD